MVTTHLVKRVDARRIQPHADAELPAINIRDTDCPVTPLESSHLRHELTVEIQVLAAGSTSPATVDATLLDAVSRIEADTPTLAGLTLDVNLVSHDIGFEQGERLLTGGLLTYSIQYRTARGTL